MITRMEGREAEEYEEENVSSCVSHISQLRHYFTNPSGQIEDQRVRNNISQIQFNPTVDEITMTIFLKGFSLVKMLHCELARVLEPESGRSCAYDPRSCVQGLLLLDF